MSSTLLRGALLCLMMGSAVLCVSIVSGDYATGFVGCLMMVVGLGVSLWSVRGEWRGDPGGELT